jgi:hypothetical protein
VGGVAVWRSVSAAVRDESGGWEGAGVEHADGLHAADGAGWWCDWGGEASFGEGARAAEAPVVLVTYFIVESYTTRESPFFVVRDAGKPVQWEFSRLLLFPGAPVHATMRALHDDGAAYVYCYDEDYKCLEMIGPPDGPPVAVDRFVWPRYDAKPRVRRKYRKKELRVPA